MTTLKVGRYGPESNIAMMHPLDPRRPIPGKKPWLEKTLLRSCQLMVVDEERVGTPLEENAKLVKIEREDIDGMIDLTALASIAMVCTQLGEVICVYFVDPAQYVIGGLDYQMAVDAWDEGKKLRMAQKRPLILHGLNISYGCRLPIGGFTAGYAPYHPKKGISTEILQKHAEMVEKAVNEVSILPHFIFVIVALKHL